MGELTYQDGTDAAVSIGMLYRKARTSHIETVKLLLLAGEQLRKQKAALAHGEWLLWVKQHQAQLGFGDWTAARLMRASLEYQGSTPDLDDDTASRLNRLIWKNDPEPSPTPSGPPVAYLFRVAEWAAKREFYEFDELDEDGRAALLETAAKMQSWLSGLAERLQNPLRRVA